MKLPRARRAAVAATLVVAAALVRAQSAPPELAAAGLDALLDLDVSGASKFSLRMSESASSVTVITSDQMRALGHRTLADALCSIRGVVVSSDRTYSYLGVRGFAVRGDYNTRILLLIDGNRVNDTVFDQAFLGSELPLDLDLVERIEFIPGQGSAVHGGNALFGVVNVVTRVATGQGSEAALALASGDSRKLRLTDSRNVGAASVLLSATVLREAGRDARYAGHDEPSHRTDHERGDQLFARIAWGELSATLIHSDRTKGLSAIPDTVFGDPRSLYRDRHTLGDLTLQRRVDGLSLWKLRAYVGHYSYRGDYLVDATPTLNRDTAESRWWGMETSLFTERFDAHRVVVGADLQFSPRRDQGNIDVYPVPATYLADHRESRRQSLYAEDQWTLTPALSLTAGARWDRVSDSAAQFHPRLALVWRPRADLVWKLIHGSAYRLPNAYESWYATDTTGGYKANPALREERVRGDELSLEIRPSAASRWTASAYVNRARSLIVQTIDPADGMLVFRNTGELSARGLELEAEEALHNGVHLRANASVQQVRDPSGQGLAELAAWRMAKGVAVLPVLAGWNVGAEAVAIGRRGEVPGYGLLNLTLSGASSRTGPRWSFSVRDVFDRHGDDPGGDSVLQPVAPQDGRTLRAQVELRF
ncbi:MAG TPA: TonB-dependent receptor [Albitalea sp.]|uniref:TonB-dependent receptor plug domain-containing protein n=1 Tax=Piscinibacter sp. TaxID=1903157 RepID=UPI002ED0E2C1